MAIGLKHLYIILASTFVIGFISGVYVYFFTQDGAEVPEEQAALSGFEVIADEYGGCESLGCGSYRILEDGTYTFVQRNRNGEDERYEGTLSDAQTDDLIGSVDEGELRELEESTFHDTCPIAFDDIAYRFDIRTNEESYTFDSCEQNISGAAFFEILTDYFDIFRVTHEN